MILIAVALLAALSYAMSGSMRGGSNIADDQLKIKIDRLLTQASDIKTGVNTVYTQGISESDLSFAHPDLTGYGTIGSNDAAEVFNESGGGVTLPTPPAGLNDGSQWEFYGHSRAPRVGVDGVADLIMVLGNVTDAACRAVNESLGYAATATPPADNDSDSRCIYTGATTRYNGSFDSVSPNIMDGGTPDITVLPAPYGCVSCNGGNHFYYTLLAR